MISDRYYMRANDPIKGLAPLLWLLGALVIGFLVQCTIDAFAPGTTARWLALSPENILHGRVWTLFTYSLLHDRENLLHLIANGLSILFIGRLLLPAIGARRFLWSYFGAVLAGGVLWLAVNFFRGPPPLVGASAGAYGLLALFCCRFAYERMTILLFFIVPLTIIPRYFLMVIGGIEAIFFLFAELFPVGVTSQFAHSAHIAGMLAGIIAYRAIRNAPASDEDDDVVRPRRTIELPSWMKKKSAAAEPPASYKVNITARENLKAEVDRILDKINTSGFGSLTAEEKRTLDEARNLMTKH